MSVLVYRTVLDRQKAFRILCGHPEERSHDHPEQRARSACRKRGRHTGDISRTDGRGQCRTKRPETGHFPVSLFFIFHHKPESFAEMPYL